MNRISRPTYATARSLRIKLLLPLLGLALIMTANGAWLIHHSVAREMELEMHAVAEAIIDATSFAAETGETGFDLQRFVHAMGGRRDINQILVAVGSPPVVVASTKHAWVDHPLANLPDERMAKFLSALVQGKALESRFLAADTELISYAPVLVRSSKSSGGLERGTVFVCLDARPMRHQLAIATWLWTGVLILVLMTVFGLTYFLIRRLVLRPVDQIVRAMALRAGGNTQVRAAIVADDEIGKLATTLNQMLDALDEKEMERTLAAAEILRARTQLMDAIEAIDAAFAMYAPDGRLLIHNHHYGKLYKFQDEGSLRGRTLNEVLRQFLANGGLPPDGQSEADFLEEHLADHRGRPGIRERRFAERWFRVSDAFTADGGRVILWTDVTDRRRAENVLAAKEQQFRSLVTNIPGTVYRCKLDADWTMLYMSEPIHEITGFPPSDFVRGIRSFASVIHPDDRFLVERTVIASVNARRPYEIEYRLLHCSGAVRWVYERGQGVFSEARVPLYLDGFILDITDRKNSEELLKRTNQAIAEARAQLEEHTVTLQHRNRELEIARVRAEAATQSKTEFLANMSHEIRTPMTAILGFADLLVAECEASPSAAKRLSHLLTIKRNGMHLLDIINDILDISKIEAGELHVERHRFQVLSLVTEVASLMRVRADAKGLSLEVRFEGAVPETIESDPTRLRQVLINLLGNAIKFTESGTVTLSVHVGGDAKSARLQFDVVDTGLGLTSDQMEHLFAPFHQADSSVTRRYGGTGLGLYISKRLCQMLGGDISVTSAVGLGSTFSATIDVGSLDGVRLVENPADWAPAAEPSPPPDREIALPRLDCRILLAEDGPDNQRLLSFHLRKNGATVTVVENGRIAVERVLAADRDGFPFDIVLMDMQMPTMDGYTATRLLRERGYDRPIIALTAHAMTGDREKCLAAGCNDFATKPIDRVHLVRTIVRWLPNTCQTLTHH
ncbi:MAG: ATP-binding protein [Planctomycetota bacterium]